MANNSHKTVLVVGATGMLGHAVLRFFAAGGHYSVVGSARSSAAIESLPAQVRYSVIGGIDVRSPDGLARLFDEVEPDVVINCVGVVKQLAAADDPLVAIPINSLLPHELCRLCGLSGARLLHVSTDCVFAGTKGMYKESDPADAQDLYGRSKHLGEVDQPHAVTLRTSIIGHELGTRHGLVEWFLSQTAGVRGYTKAVFSGLPTVELARVMHDYVIPNDGLRGVYHVSAAAIDKYTLLKDIAREYARAVDIVPDDKVRIDRSLDSTRFRAATGYTSPGWSDLIAKMRAFG
jgi:dTDP-4-dehydrorhamnose reductase